MADILLIADAIRTIRPTSHYAVKGDGAGGYLVTWEDPDQPEPSAADITAAMVGAKWERVRDSRNRKLDACDWTQVTDTALTDAERDAWQTYRQALRDITTQADPDAVTWPVEPTP